MTEPDNLVLAHLREFRADMMAEFARHSARFDEIEKRLDRIDQNGLKMWKSFIGHRSMVERTMADVDQDLADLKRRVARLEQSAR